MAQSQNNSEDAAEAPGQFLGTTVSSMCHLLARPIVLTGFFRDYLVRHFQESTIEDHALRHLVWKNDLTANILIESIHRWRPQTTEARPAVIIKRNAYSNQRKGIGDRMQGNPADRQGNPHYATYWMGSHTLFCIGGSGAQAELLATEVQRELTQFAMVIQRTIGLHRFQVVEVGEIGELEESTENFVVPVTVAYVFEERWLIQQQAPRLSGVSLSMILEC